MSANVVRAVRKYNKITQEEFAKIIGITQGAQSKIEAEILELSAVQWMIICERFRLDPHCLFTGRIQILDRESVMLVHGQDRIGAFKIPKPYTEYMGSTVRCIYPILCFADSKLGTAKLHELFRDLKMDPDYFSIMSNPINLVFIQDLVGRLAQSAGLTTQCLEELFSLVPAQEAHHYALNNMHSEGGLKGFVEKFSKWYEVSSTFEFVGHGGVLLRARDTDHVKKLKLNPEFQQFRMHYNRALFQNLGPHLKVDMGHLEARVAEGGWDIVQTTSA